MAQPEAPDGTIVAATNMMWVERHPGGKVITASELFKKWKAAVFPGQESELEFRGFRPHTATVCYVDKENGACMITVDQMASEIRLAEEAAESGKNLR